MTSSFGERGRTSILWAGGRSGFDLEARMAAAARLEAHGNPAEAESVYRQVVAVRSDHRPAWVALGLLAHRMGDLEAAIAHTEKALALDDRVALDWRNLCEMKRLAGRSAEAIAAGRRAVRLAPNDPEAHYNLGVAQADAGELDHAAESYRRLLRLDPNHGKGWNNLGHVLMVGGRPTEARSAVERAVALDPDNAEALNNLGAVAQALGERDLARTSFERALALAPNLATAVDGLRRLHEDPPAGDAADPVARAIGLWSEGRFEDALAIYDALLVERPDDLAVVANRATCLADLGRPHEAIAAAEHALRLAPDTHSARLVLATAQLETGQWEEGWKNYEARYCGAHEVQTGRTVYNAIPLPRWAGEPVPRDASILVVVEQGFGDVLQFCRYVAMLHDRFGRVGMLVSPPLLRLMEWTFGDRVTLLTHFPADYSTWDWHCMIMSLPNAFGTRIDCVPADVPYVRAAAPAVDYWRRRLDAAGASSPRIGIAWAGRPEHRFDAQRSLPFSALTPLLALPGPTWVSLQKREDGAAPVTPPDGTRWIDWTAEFSDFAATAAIVAALDLVICVDTAIVHLAGALGRPVWMANRHASEWRWMAPRMNSPWYPTLRIFHQKANGDWNSVIDAIVRAMSKLHESK